MTKGCGAPFGVEDLHGIVDRVRYKTDAATSPTSISAGHRLPAAGSLKAKSSSPS
jgi:hypothetical protein